MVEERIRDARRQRDELREAWLAFDAGMDNLMDIIERISISQSELRKANAFAASHGHEELHVRFPDFTDGMGTLRERVVRLQLLSRSPLFDGLEANRKL